MKATFIHDFTVSKINNNFYTSGGFQAHTWDRYLTHIDKINVVCRLGQSVTSANEQQKANRDEVEFFPIRNYSSVRNIKSRSEALESMKKTIKESDLVIIRLPSILGIDAYKFVKYYNKPYVVEVVGNGYQSLKLTGKLAGKLIAPYIQARMKKIILNANGAIYVTDKYLQNFYPTKGLSISISNVDMKYTVYAERSMSEKLENKKDLKIGFLGSEDIKYKNFSGGIKLLKNYFSNSDFNILVSIAGGGNINPLIEKELESAPNITINRVGKLNGKIEVNNWFKSLDLFMHPSLTEGLPRVVIEAVENEVPVIASDAGGTSEIIVSKYIFNPKDSKTFINAMNNILKIETNSILIDNNKKIKKYDSQFLQNKRNNFFKEVIERNF